MNPIRTVVGDIGRNARPIAETGNGTGGRVVEGIDAIHEDAYGPFDPMLVTHERIADHRLP